MSRHGEQILITIGYLYLHNTSIDTVMCAVPITLFPSLSTMLLSALHVTFLFMSVLTFLMIRTFPSPAAGPNQEYRGAGLLLAEHNIVNDHPSMILNVFSIGVTLLYLTSMVAGPS